MKPCRYTAKVVSVIDGDTFDLDVYLGFSVSKRVRVRLEGVNTNEIYGVKHESIEYKQGIEQKEFVQKFLSSGQQVVLVTSEETGKYGRVIGDIEVNGKLLSESLLEQFDYLKGDYGSEW
jgi:endonuclease YncB( thermonuclease family)